MAVWVPSSKIEYTFYLSLLYSILSDVLDISVPLLGSAVVLGISAICIWSLGSYAKTVYGPIAMLILFVASMVVVQVVVHEESPIADNLRPFMVWILQLIVVQSLYLRQGFCRRFPLVLLIFGAIALPFLTFGGAEVQMARAEAGFGGSLSHPGGLAEWFGFCCIYFAILGLETNRTRSRVIVWLLAVGCLFVVALTVSRGVLLATVLSVTVGFRLLLRRGFVPILVLIILTGVIYESGLFEQAVSRYEERGAEETGREVLWPAAIEHISASPLFGVGIAKVGLYEMDAARAIPPHNSFLYIALSSGVIPLMFYIGFWIQAGWRSLMLHTKGQDSDAFRLPFLLYIFALINLGDTGYLSLWALPILSVIAGSAVFYGKQSLVGVRVSDGVRIRLVQSHEANAPARQRT